MVSPTGAVAQEDFGDFGAPATAPAIMAEVDSAEFGVFGPATDTGTLMDQDGFGEFQ